MYGASPGVLLLILISSSLSLGSEWTERVNCNFFVSERGSDDENCGKSSDRPCATLTKAIEIADQKSSQVIFLCIEGVIINPLIASVHVNSTRFGMKGAVNASVRCMGATDFVMQELEEFSIFGVNLTGCSFHWRKTSIFSVMNCILLGNILLGEVSEKIQVRNTEGVKEHPALYLYTNEPSQEHVQISISNNKGLVVAVVTSAGLKVTIKAHSNVGSSLMISLVNDFPFLSANPKIELMHNTGFEFIWIQPSGEMGAESHLIMRNNTIHIVEFTGKVFEAVDNAIWSSVISASNVSVVGNSFIGTGGNIHAGALTSSHFLILNNNFTRSFMFSVHVNNTIFEVSNNTISDQLIIRVKNDDGSDWGVEIYNNQFSVPYSFSRNLQIFVDYSSNQGQIIVSNCSFVNSERSNWAGGIVAKGNGRLILKENTFYDSYSIGNGGAVYTELDLIATGNGFYNSRSIESGSIIWASYPDRFEDNFYASVDRKDALVLIPQLDHLEIEDNLDCVIGMMASKVQYESPRRILVGCVKCGVYTYSLQSGKMRNGTIINPTCFGYPRGMTSREGDGTLMIEDGFWCGKGMDAGQLKYQCYNCPLGFCKEGRRTLNETCSNLRFGTLCGSCVDGYTPSLFGSSCVSAASCSIFWMVPFVALPIFFVGLFLASSFDGTTTWKSAIFVIQIFSLLSPSNPFDVISSLFFGGRKEGNHLLGICLRGDMGVREGMFISFFTSLLAPALSLIGLLVSITYVRCFKRRRGGFREGYESINREEHRRFDSITKPSIWGRTLLQSLLLVYGSLLELSLKMITCVNIFGRTVLYLDANIECRTQVGNIFLYIFFTFLIPFPLILLGIWYWSNRYSLTNE